MTEQPTVITDASKTATFNVAAGITHVVLNVAQPAPVVIHDPAPAPTPAPVPPVAPTPVAAPLRTLYVTNKSTLVTNDDVMRMVEACRIQIEQQAAPLWGIAPIDVQYSADGLNLPAGSYAIAILDDSNQAGALGWHTEGQNEVIYGEVFVRAALGAGSTALQGQYAISSILSHEVLETWADPFANLYATNLQGQAFAYELADPVENHGYNITVSDGTAVMVSNFVTPEWFNPEPKAGDKFDYVGVLTAPFQIAPGGYVVQVALGQPQQVFGTQRDEIRDGMKGRPHIDRLR